MITAGSRLGPYEVVSPLGAGGMGEVWKARDPRLGREVAIKVLPASFSADEERLRRFEQEAKAAGLLNHPNLTAVYDIGSHDGAPYVVQELLEGETLRALLAGGRLSVRKAIDHAIQIAHGLAAAHEKGIVHRDLKPENVFVTKDGRLKILDFGLAKLTQAEAGGGATNLPTAAAGTEPGVVLGTLGYMSPEQVRGRPTDARSDIFSFGAILYEMLSGHRAFHGDSAADTMSAILKEDPPDLSVTNQGIAPGLERIVRHCLEKNPEQRFHSAHDLAFDLEALSGTSGLSSPAASLAGQSTRRGALRIAGLALAGLGALALVYWVGTRTSGAGAASSGTATVVHNRLTFRRGNVLFARFTGDGQTVVYGAAWGDRPVEIFLSRIGSPETRSLGIPGASLLSVSPSGELAVLLKKGNLFGTTGDGTLARVPLAGGTPRQMLEHVVAADWAPNGTDLAVVHLVDGATVLEYPIGKRLATSPGLGTPRVSPDGKHVAVIDFENGNPVIAVLDAAGTRQELAKGLAYIDTLAWEPSGKEIWFMGVDFETGTAIRAVDLSGRVRIVGATTDLEVLHDIAKDGTVLVERELFMGEIHFASTDDKNERDLSWLDRSAIASLSADGKMLLFSEVAEGGGPNASVYLRGTDGAPALRLGDGVALDLSPDGKMALTQSRAGPSAKLVLLPTGAGDPKTIDLGTLQVFGGALLPPDGKRIVVGASEPGHGVRGYVVDLAGGSPRAFTPEGLTEGGAVSPDGKLLAAGGVGGQPTIYPLDGGTPRPIAGLSEGDVPIQWSADGASLFIARFGELPLSLYRLHLATGKSELWKELAPVDRAGLIRIENVKVSRDGRSYAYQCSRVLASDLFDVRGWK
jgi:Tol biopolymer transport system component